MTRALFLEDPSDLPFEYIKMLLCRDVYHCLPSELDNEAWCDIELHLALMKAETAAKKR